VALAQRKEDRKALASQYMQRISGMRMQQMGQVKNLGLVNSRELYSLALERENNP